MKTLWRIVAVVSVVLLSSVAPAGAAGESLIEAVKAVSDLYCPIAGEVVEVNEAIDLDPALVNGDPYGDGWMIKLRAEDDDALEGLMSPEDYESHIDG